MSLVLYPEHLAALGKIFDQLCSELGQRGAYFSRELLAQRVIAEAVAGTLPNGGIVGEPQLTLH